MAKEWRISFDEFAAHINQIFERIARTRETVVVETVDNGIIIVQPGKPGASKSTLQSEKTDEDYQAFLLSAGSWRDVDTDQLIADIYASRESSRPPIDL